MNGADHTHVIEQGAFIASQVADFANDKALFSKFLEEISNPKILLEQSTKDKFALVQIIVKAVLHLITNETSLEKDLETLLSSSLSAIRNVLAETPTILLYRVRSGAVTGHDELWSWLTHHFVDLLCREISRTINDSLCHAIHGVFAGLRDQLEDRTAVDRCISELLERITSLATGPSSMISVRATKYNISPGRANVVSIKLYWCLIRFATSSEELESLTLSCRVATHMCNQLIVTMEAPISLQMTPSEFGLHLYYTLKVVRKLATIANPRKWSQLVALCFLTVLNTKAVPDAHKESNLSNSREIDHGDKNWPSILEETSRLSCVVSDIVVDPTSLYTHKLIEALRLLRPILSSLSEKAQGVLGPLITIETGSAIDSAEALLSMASLFKKSRKEIGPPHPLIEVLTSALPYRTHPSDLIGLLSKAATGLNSLSQQQQSIVTKSLGWSACAEQMRLSTLCKDQDANTAAFECDVCDHKSTGTRLPRADVTTTALLDLFMVLQRSEAYRASLSLRITLMRSLRSITQHSVSAADLDLNKFEAIKYLNTSLADLDSRQIRLLAGKTLTNFFRYGSQDNDEKIYLANRRRIFDILRKQSVESKYTETLVLTWTELGRIARPDDLLLILLSLVDYLSHPNIFVRYSTVNALFRLAGALRCTTYQLFSPYMRHISVQILNRSEKQSDLMFTFSKLLGISLSDFLARNQQYLLPPMILYGMTAYVRDTATATHRTVKDTLLDNMVYILSHLLTSGYNNDGGLLRFLSTVDSAFGHITMEELINSHPIPLAAELLQLFAEKSIKRESVLAALSQVAHISVKTSSSTRKTPRDMARENLRLFLQKHSLGIVSQCEESVNGYRGRRGILDRSRYITAIGELILLLGTDIEHAVPQITACLQTAMEEPGLRVPALSAWHGLMSAVSEEVIAPLISYSICLFLSIWASCTDGERRQIRRILEYFLSVYQKPLEKQIGMIPKLRFPELKDLEDRLERDYRVQSGFIAHIRQLNHLCTSDNPVIALEGLLEMRAVLLEKESEIHGVLLREWKDAVIHDTIRNLLDITSKFKTSHESIQLLAAECLGIIGAVDPVREDGARKTSREVILHNFEDQDAEESVKFVRILLENQLINAFRSATKSNVQIFLAWAIQELLKFSGFDESVISRSDDRSVIQDIEAKKRWRMFSPAAREIMTPLLSSKYDTAQRTTKLEAPYPLIEYAKNYNSWLFLFLYDLLQSGVGENARKLFGVFLRILREEETVISNFLLPYVFLNVCVGCSDVKRTMLLLEFITILGPRETSDDFQSEYLRLARESIFPVVDYLSLWTRSRKIWNRDRLAEKMKRQNRHMFPEDEEDKDQSIKRVQWFLSQIPAIGMADAALSCKSYSRALFYWEQHIRSERIDKKRTDQDLEPLYAHLQQLYININDPDGIEGVSSCLTELSLDQEILMHENAGRWTAAQSSYELALQKSPMRRDLQIGLLNCLRETGHHEVVLDQATKFLHLSNTDQTPIIDMALASSWTLSLWNRTAELLRLSSETTYDSLLSSTLLCLHTKDFERYEESIRDLRRKVTNDLASSNIESTWQCYDSLAKLAVVYELSHVKSSDAAAQLRSTSSATTLHNRLLIMPTMTKWKQHLLAVRRAMTDLCGLGTAAKSISSLWLQSAKLARKANQSQQAYKAILNALQLNGTPLAKIEHARWWWKEGHQMRAIQTLRKALDSKVFDNYEFDSNDSHLILDATLLATGKPPKLALISKAELLLTRWNDLAEHANSRQQLKEYQNASRGSQLEKPHYLMGRFYLRLLDAEAKKTPDQQDYEYLQGEYHRQVVMSYGRAMHFGVKYIFQTLPSYLQLWLDFGNDVRNVHQKAASTGQKRQDLAHSRLSHLASMNEKIKGFINRLPTYLYMLAFPQILSRINHTEKVCYALLETMILKCLVDYPKQSLWPFMAVCRSRDASRSGRGNLLIGKLRHEAKRLENNSLGRLVSDAENLTGQLMHLCTVPVIKNRASLSLTRDLDFNMAVAPSNLVVPIQSNLTVVLPAQGGVGSTKHHKAFEEMQPTVASFKDEVDVMASLQRPRKITIRASDGQSYPFLVKPNDDLRKDARLMDFNGVIQKFIRRDPDALKRLMKIRTYSVIALNEDHGLCEWVRNTRPLRDILVKTYASRNIAMQYGEVKTRLEQCLVAQHPGQAFEVHILKMFPPTFHDWFVEKFADPAQWFAARLSYSRTLAVMSMVGFVLGLGDRHGENILFDETTGDAVHVDFNCLFEKGHTFDKPEKVPFRLTHNMVDALGVTGVEGAFRKTCEITLRILRSNQDAFNTVLESFLHDPVGEFLKKVKKSATGEFEKAEAIKVLSVIANKLKGSAGAGIADKHIPLSIEGQADELIKQATDSKLLVQMYVGWTAWL